LPTPAPTPTPTPTVTVPEPGAAGPEVAAVQRRLKELGYDPGPADGSYGESTQHAVWAFQKVNGLRPDGVVGPNTQRALRNPRGPVAFASSAGPNRVEVSIDRQVMVVYSGGRIRLISHVSTGANQPFCEKGRCGHGRTPIGRFAVTRHILGWRTSYLGKLYQPVYFLGGFALHGSLSVPDYPASHGCVRVPMRVAEYLPDLLPVDTPVIVA
jgi:peptidoglycan hydrolase-like protein with peptidoglycan-binding domain